MIMSLSLIMTVFNRPQWQKLSRPAVICFVNMSRLYVSRGRSQRLVFSSTCMLFLQVWAHGGSEMPQTTSGPFVVCAFL